MIKNITRALLLSFLFTASIHANSDHSDQNSRAVAVEQMLEHYGVGFTNLEHKNLGDSVVLHLPAVDSSMLITLPNGIRLSYGEIVMFGGDLFGDPSRPVSNCSVQERGACFKAQFEALAVLGDSQSPLCSNPVNQVRNIRSYFLELEHELFESRQAGSTDSEFYKNKGGVLPKKLNRLTCGGSIFSGYLPFGHYIQLAEVNFDHFVPDSLIAYRAGHGVALETAMRGFKLRQAGFNKDADRLLELAYAQNAFANHFLSDSFSAGHMRTPRRALDEDVYLPRSLKLLLTNLMHDEDNAHGLYVVNSEGTGFMAFGDSHLFEPVAQLQRSILLEAMQRSADGVYSAFSSGVLPAHYSELDLLPVYDQIDALNDTAPLFKVVDGVLRKRVQNKNIYDFHWTRYWSGLVVLMEFKASSFEV